MMATIFFNQTNYIRIRVLQLIWFNNYTIFVDIWYENSAGKRRIIFSKTLWFFSGIFIWFLFFFVYSLNNISRHGSNSTKNYTISLRWATSRRQQPSPPELHTATRWKCTGRAMISLSGFRTYFIADAILHGFCLHSMVVGCFEDSACTLHLPFPIKIIAGTPKWRLVKSCFYVAMTANYVWFVSNFLQALADGATNCDDGPDSKTICTDK